MKVLVPDRFDVIRVLKESADSKTVLAVDNTLNQSEMLVKVTRTEHLNRTLGTLIERVSWFLGIRHHNFAQILDVGVTPKGDLYYVRDYLPESYVSSLDNAAFV